LELTLERLIRIIIRTPQSPESRDSCDICLVLRCLKNNDLLKKYSIENECFEDEVEAKKAEALLAA